MSGLEFSQMVMDCVNDDCKTLYVSDTSMNEIKLLVKDVSSSNALQLFDRENNKPLLKIVAFEYIDPYQYATIVMGQKQNNSSREYTFGWNQGYMDTEDLTSTINKMRREHGFDPL